MLLHLLPLLLLLSVRVGTTLCSDASWRLRAFSWHHHFVLRRSRGCHVVGKLCDLVVMVLVSAVLERNCLKSKAVWRRRGLVRACTCDAVTKRRSPPRPTVQARAEHAPVGWSGNGQVVARLITGDATQLRLVSGLVGVDEVSNRVIRDPQPELPPGGGGGAGITTRCPLLRSPQSCLTRLLAISDCGWEPGLQRRQVIFRGVAIGCKVLFTQCVCTQNAQTFVEKLKENSICFCFSGPPLSKMDGRC